MGVQGRVRDLSPLLCKAGALQLVLLQLALRHLSACGAVLRLMWAWLEPRGRLLRPRAVVKAGDGKRRPPPIPRELLQMLAAYLEPADIAAARLACREWRELLSAQVHCLSLPSPLWQFGSPGQLSALHRLLDSFRHAQQLRLAVEGSRPCDAWCVGRAADALRAVLPALRRLDVSSVMAPGQWHAALEGLSCLSPQLTGLRLANICWPPPSALPLLQRFSSLQSLGMRSPHFSRVEAQHLQGIAQLTQLRELTLCFRTVAGTAHAPLSLEPLSRLVQLTSLDVQYTGLLELASAVTFGSPAVTITVLQNLQRLQVALVPMPCLGGLQRLTRLRSLSLQQAQPLTAAQCCALAGCQHLDALELSSVQWGDIPRLAPLTGLTSLSLAVWQPARGSLPGAAAGRQLLQLRSLCRLRSLRLRGQCEVTSELLGSLAGHWGGLTSLDLCCVMPDGSQGLSAFGALRRLRLQPYKWDVWSSDPPVLLYPSVLPPGLTCLEALDVWCVDEPPGSAGAAGGLRHSSSYCSFTGILSSVGSNLCSLGSSSSAAAAAAAAAAGAGAGAVPGKAAGDGGGGGCAPPPAADAPPPQPTQQAPAREGEGLVMSTPHLRRLVLRSNSPFDRHQLPMPDLSACSGLECLELQHSQLTTEHLRRIAASCASLASLRLVAIDERARIRASGLTVLTTLTALTRLSVHAHERALNRRVRAAVSSMSQLRSLTLLTSPDHPTSFAKHLGCLTQLTNLMTLRVGLGFGALDALRRLGVHVARSLPHCTYEMLTDACSSD